MNTTAFICSNPACKTEQVSANTRATGQYWCETCQTWQPICYVSTARSIAHQRATDAGLDPNTADAAVSRAMEVFHPELTTREWLELVDQEIQRHAQP